MNNRITLKVAGVAVIVVAALAFYVGSQYGKNSVATAGANRYSQSGGGATMRGRGGAGNGGLVTGSVIAKDSTSITVEIRQGGSKIIFYNPQTEVGKTVSGSAADISVGKNVVVSGTPNSDGSVTAQTIQIRPASTTMMVR